MVNLKKWSAFQISSLLCIAITGTPSVPQRYSCTLPIVIVEYGKRHSSIEYIIIMKIKILFCIVLFDNHMNVYPVCLDMFESEVNAETSHLIVGYTTPKMCNSCN